MTDLVSLLFITMIPIDCKITISFPILAILMGLHLFYSLDVLVYVKLETYQENLCDFKNPSKAKVFKAMKQVVSK